MRTVSASEPAGIVPETAAHFTEPSGQKARGQLSVGNSVLPEASERGVFLPTAPRSKGTPKVTGTSDSGASPTHESGTSVSCNGWQE